MSPFQRHMHDATLILSRWRSDDLLRNGAPILQSFGIVEPRLYLGNDLDSFLLKVRGRLLKNDFLTPKYQRVLRSIVNDGRVTHEPVALSTIAVRLAMAEELVSLVNRREKTTAS